MLRCNYDLETDSLYAVKWYRGSEEFYRFLPKEAPPKQAFPINGVVVDVSKKGVLLKCFMYVYCSVVTIIATKVMEKNKKK